MLTRLHVADHPAAVWAGAVEPWLRAHGTNWRERRMVLAPNAAWLATLKAAAVESRLPAIGVHWLTPGRWRALALSTLPGETPRLGLREDLHLLLELAASRLPANPLARAYGQDPAPFQEILDALDGAGWAADVLPDSAARELANLAVKLRVQAGWTTSAEADRRLRDAAANNKLPLFGQRLLAVGFCPADWPLRALLEAACVSCAETEMILDVVDVDQTPAAAWVGAWEEKFGDSAEWLEAPNTPAPFAPLAASMLAPSPASVAPVASPLHLWLAEDLQAEADLVVAQALRFLADAGAGTPARVGLVVGAVNSPLAREVAARLVALGLPHHDAPGHLPGRTSPQSLFESWLDWQENGRLAGLVVWLRTAQIHGQFSAETSTKIEVSLKAAMGATLVDDPAVLAAWLAETPGEHAAAREFLSAWPRLPESAPWKEFIAVIAVVAQKLGWPAPAEILTARAEPLGNTFAEALPRSAVLRWVRAVTRIPGRTRNALGREPFAPVQIVEAASAAAQRWTHLVLGGLQHGEWPASDGDSALLDEVRLTALNRQVLRQGPQGEGHWTVAPEHGLLLSQYDRRKLERAAFARLAALPTNGLALTSRRTDPADGRPARLSEYFWSAARVVLGRLPDEQDWEALAQTACGARDEFLEVFRNESAKISSISPVPEVAQTARAFAARREPESPFDEYSFCLKKPPASPLRLSCKAWENAVNNPGAAWFAKVLRVEPRWDPATEDVTRLSIGTWAHAWVRPGPNSSSLGTPPASLPLLSLPLWQKLAADRAGDWHGQIAAAFARASRSFPESWLDAWAEAARIADTWISALAERSGWPQASAEVVLSPGLLGKLPGGAGKIPLTGRVDLVLWPRAVTFAAENMMGADAWVIDFKTGKDEPLKIKKVAEGKGLQLALYGLALQALGAREISLTILGRDGAAEPQLLASGLTDAELEPLWCLLADFAIAGRWGERRDLADRFTDAGPYPSATLPVPVDILRRKWARTHTFPP